MSASQPPNEVAAASRIAKPGEPRAQSWFTESVEASIAILGDLGLSEIVASNPVKRLRSIGFMGVLGPGPQATSVDSRLNHSIGVALLTYLIANKQAVGERLARHLVAASLLHDAANRALSHTCEGAFDKLAGTDGHRLTKAILTGSPADLVPKRFQLSKLLGNQDLDPKLILSMLGKRPEHPELVRFPGLVNLFSSPINPDTIDGILRAAFLFGLEVLHPLTVISVIEYRDSVWGVERSNLAVLDAFWATKGIVYDKYINSPEAISVEAQYAAAAYQTLRGYTSSRLFSVTDADVRPLLDQLVHQKLEGRGGGSEQLDLLFAPPPLRFREPRQYIIDRQAELPYNFIPFTWLIRRYKKVGFSTVRTTLTGDSWSRLERP